MRDTAQLNDLAAADMATLKGEGIVLTPAEIVELNALAWDVQNPATRIELSRGRPVCVGGAVLWPLTLQAHEWLERVGYHLPLRRGGSFSVAYAMAHAYTSGLDVDGREAEKAVRRWRGSLRCTRDALQEAVEQVQAQDDTPELPPDPADAGEDQRRDTFGDFSLKLAAATGTTPDFWERHCAAEYAFQMMQTVLAQAAAEGRSIPDDATIQAEQAYGWRIEKIRRRHAAEVNHG